MLRASEMATTLSIKTTSKEQREWLAGNLVAVTRVIEYLAKARSTNRYATPLFGEKRAKIESVVPEAKHLSGYVNIGMSGLGANILLSDYKNKFRYRSSNPGAIRQFPMDEGGGLYVSGYPSGYLTLIAPEQLPPTPISALIFTLDTDSPKPPEGGYQWRVTVMQRYTRPKLPKGM